uniref:Uncharacterized protein n=1 Tax=Ciona savignyi TaxID=51511 RepID=H2YEA0_CIOSA
MHGGSKITLLKCGLGSSVGLFNITRKLQSTLPTASLVLSEHLKSRNYPHWTSYFVKYKDVKDDQRGKSHFNWSVRGHNYHILRTGCWPFIKYHCTKRPFEDLSRDDKFFRVLKILNLGIPCLAYGVGSWFLISSTEIVKTGHGDVTLYFLYQENPNARY